MCWTVKRRVVHRQQTVSEYTLTIVHYSVGRSDLKQYAGYCCGLNDMSMCGCFDCSRRHCNSRCALILPLSVFIIRCIHVLLFCQLSKPLQDVSPYWLFVVVVVVMPRPCTASVFFIYFFLIFALLPTCLGSCWRLVWFALSYADVITVQEHGWNNSCSPLPFYCYNQPYTSITDCLQPALPA